MTSLLIVAVLLFSIYFLSYKTNQLLLRFLFLTTHNVPARNASHSDAGGPLTTAFLSLLLYPGVVVHELSHLIMAVILFVPVKSMTLVPKIIEGNKLQGGSVTIEKVDPLRRTLIGIAPLFVGITVLWLVTVYLLPEIPYICHSRPVSEYGDQTDSGSAPDLTSGLSGMTISNMLCNNEFKLTTYNLPLTTILALYLIFSISSTMYSSKKDLDALLIMIPLLIFVGVIAYILGFQFVWMVKLVNQFERLFQNIIPILTIPIIIQIALFILLKSIFSVLRINHAHI